jgi:hypothetical protein
MSGPRPENTIRVLQGEVAVLCLSFNMSVDRTVGKNEPAAAFKRRDGADSDSKGAERIMYIDIQQLLGHSDHVYRQVRRSLRH